MTLVSNVWPLRRIPTSVIGMRLCCLLVLNTSCSRYTSSFTTINSYPGPASEFNLVHDNPDSVKTTPELFLVSNKENLLLIDHSLPNSKEKRNEPTRIKRQVNASKETKEIIKVTGKEPVNGNSKKTGLAAAGFIFSAISLVLLLSQSPLFLLTLPLALLFSILGLKSKEKTLSITGLIIAAGITAFVIAYFIFFIISLQNTPK